MLYSRGNTRLLRVDTNKKPGMYTIKMNAPNPCSVQVRRDSPVVVYAGFSQPPVNDTGSHMDNVTADPVQSGNYRLPYETASFEIIHFAALPALYEFMTRSFLGLLKKKEQDWERREQEDRQGEGSRKEREENEG